MRTGEKHVAKGVKGTRGASAGYVRALGLVWTLVLMLALVPLRSARADSSNFVIISDAAVFTSGSNVVKTGWEVAATNVYNAALLVCGFDVDDSRLTADVRAKLSNSGTGGAFYDFAQTFVKITDKTQQPSWTQGSNSAFGELWNIYASNQPFDLYYVEFVKEALDAAKSDLQKVLSGEDLGGGSGSGGTTVTNQLVMNINQINSSTLKAIKNQSDNKYGVTNTRFVVSLWNTYLLPNNLILSISDSILSKYESYKNDYDFVMTINFLNSSYYDYYVRAILYVLPKGKYEENASLVQINNKTYTNISSITVTDKYYNAEMANMYYTFDGTTIRLLNNFTSSLWSHNAGTIDTTSFDAVQLAELGTVEPLPPSNWPTDPTPTPKEPPEVPEPPTTTPPTQPTPPTSPTPPTYITKPTYTYTTYTADLQGVLDAMHEHCMHLQQALYDNFAGLYDVLIRELDFQFNLSREQETSNFGWLGSVIGGYFTDLSDYLRELFEWLAGQFDFSFTAPGYDDGSLISWLKKIYSKLGTGPVNTRPVDPVADPKGVGDWLGQLLSNFISALLGIGVGAIGGVSQNFQQLTTKFPFCVPWDIAAMIGIMVATPEPPIYDVPIMCLTADGLQQVGQWHIDCSPFDPYMGGIRTMETVAFAFALCFKTDFFKQAVGVVTGKGK